MVVYGLNKGTVNKNSPDYICSKDEFIQDTGAEDGSTLVVIDEDTHTVDSYCIAFNGKWNYL